MEQFIRGQKMYSEVRVYDGKGKLKKTISVDELNARSDYSFKVNQKSYCKPPQFGSKKLIINNSLNIHKPVK